MGIITISLIPTEAQLRRAQNEACQDLSATACNILVLEG
jgi:hypothetical protein